MSSTSAGDQRQRLQRRRMKRPWTIAVEDVPLHMIAASSAQVALLNSGTGAAEYAAVKTLLAISNFLRKRRFAAWEDFLLCLWTFARHCVCGTEPCCSERPRSPAAASFATDACRRCPEGAQCATGSIRLALGDESLSAASNAVDVLRRILKECLKHPDETSRDLDAFFWLFNDHVKGVVAAACGKGTVPDCCLASGRRMEMEDPPDSPGENLRKELLLGSVLRLLCTASRIATATSASCGEEDSPPSPPGPCLEAVEELIPHLSASALARHANCERNDCISFFLCHKLLMIMTRLSECFETRVSLAFSCLNGLHQHGAWLLESSIQATARPADSLEESPFSVSLRRAAIQTTGGSRTSPSAKHLCRRAIFIMFKIASLTCQPLLSNRATGGHDHALVMQERDFSKEECSAQSCALDKISKRMLVEWLNQQMQPAIDVPGVTTRVQAMLDCTSLDELAESFLQVYSEEDDLMLKMLLLLSNEPSCFANVMIECPW